MNPALEYINQSSDLQRQLFMLARGVIMNASHNIVENFAYKVPFYSGYGKICYFNRLKNGIDIGFIKGFELSDQHGALVSGGRTQVKSLRYLTLEDFDESILRETMQEAVVLDQYNWKKNHA